MKKEHQKEMARRINDLLEYIDEDVGNPEFCYEKLSADMAKAAAAVYDACMAGQKYLLRMQKSS